MSRSSRERRTSVTRAVVLALAFLVCGGGASAVSAPPNQIRNVHVEHTDSKTKITVEGSASPSFTAFRLESPERLVVDLANSRVRGVPSVIDQSTDIIGGVAVSEYTSSGAPISRIVVNLRKEAAYRVRKSGHSLIIVLHGAPSKSKGRVKTTPHLEDDAAQGRIERAKELKRQAEQASQRARKESEEAARLKRVAKSQAEEAERQLEQALQLRREASVEAQEAKQEREHIQQALSKLEQELAVRDREARRAQREAERARTALKMAQQRADKKLEERSSSLQRDLTQAKAELKTLRAQAEEAEKIARVEMSKRIKVEDRLAELEKNLQQAEETSRQARRERDLAANNADRLEEVSQNSADAAKRAREEAKEAVLAQKEAAQAYRQAAAHEKEKLKAVLVKREKEAIDAQKKAVEASKARAHAESALAKAAAELETSKSALAEARTQAVHIRQLKDVALAKATKDRKEAEQAARRAEERAAQAKEAKERIEQQLSALEEKFKRQNQNLAASSDRKVSEAVAALEQAEKKRQESQERLKKTQEDLVLARRAIESASLRAKKMEGRLTAVKAEADEAKSRAQEYKTAMERAERMLAEQSTVLKRAEVVQKQKTRLAQERARLEREKDALEKELTEARRSAKTDGVVLAKRQKELANRARTLQSKEREISGQERKLAKEETLIANRKKVLAEREGELRRRGDQLDSARKELEAARAQFEQRKRKDAEAAKRLREQLEEERNALNLEKQRVARMAEEKQRAARNAEEKMREARMAEEKMRKARAAEEKQRVARMAEEKQRVARMAEEKMREIERRRSEMEKKVAAADQGPLTQEQKRLLRLAEMRGEKVAAKQAPGGHDIAPPKAKRAASRAPVEKKRPQIADIRFDVRGEEQIVIIETDRPVEYSTAHDARGNAMLDFKDAELPSLLVRTLDVSDFGGIIQQVSSFKDGEEVRVEVEVDASAKSRIERKGNNLVWTFKPVQKRVDDVAIQGKPSGTDSRTVAKEDEEVYAYPVDRTAADTFGNNKKKHYAGRRIDLDFKDADIHNILRLLADVGHVNVITSEEVSGTVTIRMRDVPWDQALDVILQAKRLGMVRQGNIIRVAPLETLEKERELEIARRKQKVELEPLETRLIPVSYARAAEIQPRGNDLLTERGKISVDERTNVLIARDVPDALNQLEALVRNLDTQTPQVLIESRIIEASSNYAREIGIQWGGDFTASTATGNPTGLAFPSSVGVAGGATDNQTPTSGLSTSATAQPNPNFAVNLPASVGTGSGGALGITLGSITNNANLSLRLSAMEESGFLRILSSPKILTLDNREAHIEQGTLIPYSQISARGIQTAFKEAKLNLTVTPHVTADGSILMNLKVMRDEPDFANTGARGDPTILKREAETELLVNDGHTAVIGGIFTRNHGMSYSKVPFFADIPIIGWLFKNRSESDRRSEMLIFITPRIVNRAESIGQ